MRLEISISSRIFICLFLANFARFTHYFISLEFGRSPSGRAIRYNAHLPYGTRRHFRCYP
jgi:hypothetical protein